MLRKFFLTGILSSVLIGLLLISLPFVSLAYDPQAKQIKITDTGGYYNGTDVEAALQEIGAGNISILKAGDEMGDTSNSTSLNRFRFNMPAGYTPDDNAVVSIGGEYDGSLVSVSLGFPANYLSTQVFGQAKNDGTAIAAYVGLFGMADTTRNPQEVVAMAGVAYGAGSYGMFSGGGTDTQSMYRALYIDGYIDDWAAYIENLNTTGGSGLHIGIQHYDNNSILELGYAGYAQTVDVKLYGINKQFWSTDNYQNAFTINAFSAPWDYDRLFSIFYNYNELFYIGTEADLYFLYNWGEGSLNASTKLTINSPLVETNGDITATGGILAKDQSRYFFQSSDFTLVATQGAFPGWLGAAVSGSIAAQVDEANHPGIALLKSGSGANSGYRFNSSTNSFLIAGGETTELIFRVVDATNLTLRFGFTDTTSYLAPTDAVEMLISGTTLSGETYAGGITTSTTSTYTITPATWYKAKIQVSSDASGVAFTLYDVNGYVLWYDAVTTNIPTAAGQETTHGVVVTESAGAAQSLVDLDYMNVYIDKILNR